MTNDFCVCVPARNEAERIPRLIAALGRQALDQPVRLALCVNNSSDGTAEAAQAAAERTRGQVLLTLAIKTFSPPVANAGSARRVAMELGAALVGRDGLLISTDADCRPPEDWVAANLAFARSNAVVGGRINLDEDEDLPASLLAVRHRFDHYWKAVREIEDAADPRDWDPAPRHGDHTGASLAIPVSLYSLAGGVPPIETGEDRALVDAAISIGGQLTHPPDVWTRTSPRTTGRAAHGMADDMRRWSEIRNTVPMVPHFDHWRSRAAWRSAQRRLIGDNALPAAEAKLPPMLHDMALPDL